MAVLSDASINQAVKAGTLGITPFHADALQPASYDMRLHWKLLLSPTRRESGRIVDLRKEPRKQFAVEPGRFVGILTEEKLSLPLSMAGRFGLRSEFTRHGLVAFGGIQIDPGFKGRLAISLFHAGPEPMRLKCGARMFTVEFHTLLSPASTGYRGPFQNLLDFHKVQKEFILNAHTASLTDMNLLPGEVAHIRQRLAIHETAPHVSTYAKSLHELAVAQGVKPVDDPAKLLGGWPEDDDFDEFLRTLSEWRESKA